MSGRGQARRRTRTRRRRTGLVVGALAAAAAVAAIAIWVVPALPATPTGTEPAPQIATEPTPTPTPLTEAELLLSTTTDPAACAVTLSGDGLALPPVLETVGALFANLPIPQRDGQVFAGWYAADEQAAAYDTAGRVNGADEVACIDQQLTLYAAWMSPEQSAAADTAVPILMYHQFTDKPEGEDNWLRLNYAYVGDWEAHLAYISGNGFYLPTWPELSAFIDGRLYLPPRSVMVTDDDADASWFALAVPLVEQYKVLTTSFVITVWHQAATPSRYVLQRSHTHDMHTAGANGKGRMVNWSAAEIAADLETSAQILGAREVIAYPFGHYNDTTKEGVAAAGFEMARTIEQGYVHVGTDKLALPCIRINYGMTVDDLARLIG